MTEGEAHETAQSEGCAKQRPAGLNYGRNIVIGDTERRPTPVIKSAETLHTQNRPAQLGDIGDKLSIFYHIPDVIFPILCLYMYKNHILNMCIFT